MRLKTPLSIYSNVLFLFCASTNGDSVFLRACIDVQFMRNAVLAHLKKIGDWRKTVLNYDAQICSDYFYLSWISKFTT